MVVAGILAMLSLLVSWLGLGALFTGCGLLVFRICRKRISSISDVLDACWLGWGFTIFALIVWNFWLPVKGPFFGLFASAGIVGCLLTFLDTTKIVRERLQHRRMELLVCLGLLTFLALLVANRAIGAPLNPDMGLYYASSVRFAVEYPAIPGIGNLHTRLAYNNSTFLYAALLESGLWTHRSHHVASSLPLLLMLARILYCGVRVLRPREAGRAPRLSEVFGLCFIAPWVALFLGRDLSSPAPDLCVYALGFELCLKFIEFLEQTPEEACANWSLTFILFFAVLGISHKLSFAVLGGLTSVIALIVSIKRGPNWRCIAVSTVCAVLAFGCWAQRGIILSGYPLYPNTSIDLQKDWAVPKITGVYEVKSVLHAARNNKGKFEEIGEFNNWSWLPSWFNKQVSRKQRFFTLIPFVLALGFIVAACVAGRGRTNNRALWLAFIPLYGGMIFWFLTAPHPRFAGVVLWAPCVLAFSLWLIRTGWTTQLTGFGAGPIAIASFVLITSANAPAAYSPVFNEFTHERGFALLPEPKMHEFVTRSGAKLWRPDLGTETKPIPPYVYYAPLPCTPFPNEYLRLRKDGDLTQGFSIDPEYVRIITEGVEHRKRQREKEKEPKDLDPDSDP